jgi:hypothetical protein
MKRAKRTVRWQVDGYTRFCLTAIVVLMTVMVVGLWAERVPLAGQVVAAGSANKPVDRYQPTSVLELGDLIRAQEQTNGKLEELKKLLESGDVKVQVVGEPSKDTGVEGNAQPTSDDSNAGNTPQGIYPN